MRRLSRRLQIEKFKTPPKQEVSSKSIESERRSTKRKRKDMHPGLGCKEVPILSHISETLEANQSLYKILGEDITSPRKDAAKSGGKKGHHNHG